MSSDKRIAVIGYSCQLPGGDNVFEAWDMITKGINNIKDLPADRLDVTAYYSPDKKEKDKIYCKRGGFINEFDFLPREFGLNMLQVEDCDANQTLTLVKVKEALESANIKPFGERKNIGCVLGIGGGQKLSNELYSRLAPHTSAQRHLNDHSVILVRVAPSNFKTLSDPHTKRKF